MRWLRWPARPSRRWAQVVTRGRASGRPITPPPAIPRELVDVIGVGLSQTLGGITLQLLSIERYREGHILLLRLLREQRGFPRHFLSPELQLRVLTGSGASTTTWPMGGGGGGGRDGVFEYRMSYAIVPPPDGADGEIVVEVSEVRWRRHRMDAEPDIASTDLGPWRFVVKL